MCFQLRRYGILDWCATSYYNVWSADNTLTGNDNKVVKTVYDLRPSGFACLRRMPSRVYLQRSGRYRRLLRFTVQLAVQLRCGIYGQFGLGVLLQQNVRNEQFDPSGGAIFCQASGFRDYTSGSVFNIGNSGYCWTAVPIT